MKGFAKCSGRIALGAIAFFTAQSLTSPRAEAVPTNPPHVSFNVNVLGGSGGPFNTGWNQVGVGTATPGVYSFDQLGSPFGMPGLIGPGSEWSISSWNFQADNDPAGAGQATGARLGSVFTVTNNLPVVAGNPGANHLFFSISISMETYAAAQPTQFFGSGGLNLLAGAPGGFHQVEATNGPIWNYLVNGNVVTSLFAQGYNLGNSGGTSSESLNINGAPLAGLSPSSIGITMNFDLTPGDTLQLTGTFAYIPAPGCLALLSLAALAGRSRRRV